MADARQATYSSSVALLAACLALALPSMVAAPYHDGMDTGADLAAWLHGQGSGGLWLALPAHAQSLPVDNNLDVDNTANPAILVAPNQINVTYTANAYASANYGTAYLVSMDFDEVNGNGYDLRNVRGIEGNETMVHRLTFDGPPAAKDAVAHVLIGNITNAAGALWSLWESTWADPTQTLSYYPVEDAQRPAVVSAVLTSITKLDVTYDEPVLYSNYTDYTLTLKDNSTVPVTAVQNKDGTNIAAYETAALHVLVLGSSVDMDEIKTLGLVATNITDFSQYNVNGSAVIGTDFSQYDVNGSAVIGNALANDTVAVTDGVPPTPKRAEIVGPIQINVTFTEPVYASLSSYANITINSNYLRTDAKNRTVTEVAGNGTAVHTLTLDKPESPITLPPTGTRASGSLYVVNVSDMAGNVLDDAVAVGITDTRTLDGVPWMIAARFTGPNEVTVSYNASATIQGGYSVLAEARSMPGAPDGDKFVYKWGSYNVSYVNATTGQTQYATGMYEDTFVRLDIASVEGNGTALHKLRIGGDGVQKTAMGLINTTGLAQRDGTPVGRDYANIRVYDEQLPKIVSARITGNNTIVVEYDQPTFGPLSGYQKVALYDASGAPMGDDRAVSMVRTGSMATLTSTQENITSTLDSLDVVSSDWIPSIGISGPPPVVLDRHNLTRTASDNTTVTVGYAGNLLLSNGRTVWIQVLGGSNAEGSQAGGEWLIRSDRVGDLSAPST